MNGEPLSGLPVRLFNAFTNLMNSIGTLWVFGMMFIICADIASRNFFNHPLNGVPEIIAFSIAGTIYLQLANTLHAGRFTRAELLIEWLEVRLLELSGVGTSSASAWLQKQDFLPWFDQSCDVMGCRR